MATETAREIFIEWLRAVVDEPSHAPSTLWHYTSATGLRGILSSGVLWATDAFFLNDAAEVKYGIDLVFGTLPDIDLDNVRDATRDFLFGLVDPKRGPLRRWLEESLRPFVTCFCSADNLLSQWRAYAGDDKFGGYAIGFTPPGALSSWAQTAPHPLTLRRVMYEEDVQRRICRELLEPLVEYLDLAPEDQAHQDAFAAELVNGIAEVAVWCKHPAFAEEGEWRLSYGRLQDPDPLPILHRASSGLLVPYVELAAPRAVGAYPDSLPITAIQCGPSLDPDRKLRGVSSLLGTVDTYGPIDVLSSATPARL